MGYPTQIELTAFLHSRGLSCSSLSKSDLELALATAIAEWEFQTGWEPFLATSSDDPETRTIDGPEGRIIFPPFGILSLTDLSISGASLVADEDYFLQFRMPGGPYTGIELSGYATGERRSISLTGVFGYSLSVPLDVKQAICAKVAADIYPIITGVEGDVVREKQGPVEIEYAKPQDGYGGIRGGFSKQFEDAVCRYKRVTL